MIKKYGKVIVRKWKWMVPPVLICWFLFSLPRPLFKDPTCTLLQDRNGNLLGVRIASDYQWRFPQDEIVSDKLKKCILAFEDNYFYYHNGVNPASMARALYQDIKKRRVVSGGSTLTMQVIRLSRKGKSRTVFEKFIEAFQAMRLELTYSKAEILNLYMKHAPYGGNIVGVQAASWRYFGKSPSQLTWAEAATLAVLPNSPSLIFPGKNQKKLLEKRNRLLSKLQIMHYVSHEEFMLAVSEPLPDKWFPIPSEAPHLLDRAIKDGKKSSNIKTTLDLHLQELCNSVVERYSERYAQHKIFNAAVLVLEVETGNVLAYVGNTNDYSHPEYGCQVDVIGAPRSTGSILKPFLYASMLNDGQILPNTLVPDIPIQLGSFIPENYNYTYDGAVPAKKALSRSLNVPCVKMLQSYGISRFNFMLKKMGITTLSKPPDHYGLSIILGGSEADLWDLAGIYASMARTLNHYNQFNNSYFSNDFHPANYLYEKEITKGSESNSNFLTAAPIWYTFEAMNEVSRPDEDAEWQQFSGAKIAWKTGTSFGSRDAWAIGCNPQYVVAVWVGNADGVGRPGMTGVAYAAPIMFEVFKSLRPSGWFATPYQDMVMADVCEQSGYKVSQYCEHSQKVWIQKSGTKSLPCPYHQLVLLDATGTYRVNSQCESVNNMQLQKWFVLPPVMEFYYKSRNPFYKTLPPYRDDCKSDLTQERSFEMIYPKSGAKVYIPVDIDGKREKVVFKAAHNQQNIAVYWYLDDHFMGITKDFHNMGLSPSVGIHNLVLVDKNGQSLRVEFEVFDKTQYHK